MSLRRSTAPEVVQAVRVAAEQALRSAPASPDPGFAALREARIGEPALVETPEGQPAFWIVPTLSNDLACGYVQVDLSFAANRVAVFGADPAAWPNASFFSSPSESVLQQVRAAYPGATLSIPTLSYAGSPARWGWLVLVHAPRGPLVLITPGGWCEVPSIPPRQDRE